MQHRARSVPGRWQRGIICAKNSPRLEGRRLHIKMLSEFDVIGVKNPQRNQVPEMVGLGVRGIADEDTGV